MPDLSFAPDNEAIRQTREGIQKLEASSLRLEKLTVRLNRLTFVLMVLAILSGGIGLTDIILRLYLHL
jgi:hypothetical protein